MSASEFQASEPSSLRTTRCLVDLLSLHLSHCKGSARRTQSRACSSYAEPQPSLAVYSQMHCKVTTKTTSFQISTPVACKNPLRNRGNFVNKYKLWQSLPETMAVSLRECGTFLQRLRHQKVTGNR